MSPGLRKWQEEQEIKIQAAKQAEEAYCKKHFLHAIKNMFSTFFTFVIFYETIFVTGPRKCQGRRMHSGCETSTQSGRRKYAQQKTLQNAIKYT